MSTPIDRLGSAASLLAHLALVALLAGHSALGAVAAASGVDLPGAEAIAQEAGGAGKPAEVLQTTEVGGKIPPEFLGRWAAFAHVKLPSGVMVHFAGLWEVREGPEHYELVLRSAALPAEVHKKMQAATQSGEAWQASPEDVRQVSEQWDDLLPVKSQHTKIESKLLAAEAYPPEFERDAVTKGSEFALVFNELFTAKAGVPRTYSIYAVRNREPERFTGTFVNSSMAMGLVPVPITLKGEFEAHRVGGPPISRSWFQRLLDVFSGCGGG
jgi:hypothetical protein